MINAYGSFLFSYLARAAHHNCNKSFSRSQNSLMTSNTPFVYLMAIKLRRFAKTQLRLMDAHIYI